MPEVGRSALLVSQSGSGMQRPIQPTAANLHYWNSRIGSNPPRVLGGRHQGARMPKSAPDGVAVGQAIRQYPLASGSAGVTR